jgi:hypothetical protein
MEQAREPSLLKLMLLRGALIGAALAAIFALLFHDGRGVALGAVVAGLILGAIFSGTAFVEERARRSSSPSRAREGALVSGVFAFACGVLAIFQVPYTVVAITTRSQEDAIGVVREAYDKVMDHLPVYISLPLMLSPIFAIGTWVRVRGTRGRGRVLATLATPILSAPGLALFACSVSSSREVPEVAMALAGCLLAVPLLLELADSLERRLASKEQ